MENRPRPQEQEALEDGVIQSVKHRPNQRYCRQLRMSHHAENQGGAKAHENDANILDAVVGQQSF